MAKIVVQRSGVAKRAKLYYLRDRVGKAVRLKERRTDHGSLRWMKGLPVLQLHGTARERGYAHGFLVGEQILDFFEFYVLEDSWQSARRYQADAALLGKQRRSAAKKLVKNTSAVLESLAMAGCEFEIALTPLTVQRSMSSVPLVPKKRPLQPAELPSPIEKDGRIP